MKELLRKWDLKITNAVPAIIAGYFFLQLVFDAIQKCNKRYDLEFLKLHRYLKLVILIFVFGYIFTHYKKIKKQDLWIYVGINFIFLIALNFSSDRIEFFLQYQFFLCMGLLFYIVNFDKKIIDLICRGFKIIVLVNAVLILLGLLFDLDIFKTYYLRRFGFNGLLITPMLSTIFYLSAFTLSIVRKDVIFIIAAVASSLLVGSKALIMGMPILICFIVLKERKRIPKKFIGLLIVISLIVTSLILRSDLFQEIINRDGIITAFFSYRDILLIKSLKTIAPAYNVFQFLFGSLDLAIVRTELEFIDIFFFFGISGLILIIWFLHRIKVFYGTGSISESYFYTIILVALFSGNIIAYPFNAFLLFMTLKITKFYSIKPKHNAK